MSRFSFSIRTKLIVIFVLIKVLPLIVLAWFSWHVIIFKLAGTLEKQTRETVVATNELVGSIADTAINNSIEAMETLRSRAILSYPCLAKVKFKSR